MDGQAVHMNTILVNLVSWANRFKVIHQLALVRKQKFHLNKKSFNNLPSWKFIVINIKLIFSIDNKDFYLSSAVICVVRIEFWSSPLIAIVV